MSEFFSMGGYAPYVWSSYALTALVLVANIIGARVREREIEKNLAGRLRRESRGERS